MMASSSITVGDYIIIQRHNFRKLHKYNKTDSCVSLGRDTIDLTGIEGCRYFSQFKMVAKSNKKGKEFYVELVDATICLKDQIGVTVSGNDNRNILDDGCSQKLTAADIETLKADGNKASDIVETLITNSNTFHNKTEYSQEKYLKKKEKKYFEYIQILKPSLRIIAEIIYRLDPSKIQNLRIDTLSQVITQANVYSEGVHLLYDSGSNGLVSAALLSVIGQQTRGKLLHMHPGNMSQKQALLAMNYSEEQLNRCISVNVYSALRQYYQGCDTNPADNKAVQTGDDPQNELKRKIEEEVSYTNKIAKIDHPQVIALEHDITEPLKNQVTEPKKPKWHYDNITAAEFLKNKLDSLVIACKEDPSNIFKELMIFVKPGRPFVVYNSVAEPLQHLYMTLKSNSNVSALKLTCNWMRNYQVLPERTHPEVTMNGSSGYLLTGYILK